MKTYAGFIMSIQKNKEVFIVDVQKWGGCSSS